MRFVERVIVFVPKAGRLHAAMFASTLVSTIHIAALVDYAMIPIQTAIIILAIAVKLDNAVKMVHVYACETRKFFVTVNVSIPTKTIYIAVPAGFVRK